MRSIVRCLAFLLLAPLLTARAQSPDRVDSAFAQMGKIKDDSLRLEAMFTYNKYLFETAPSLTGRVIHTALNEARRLRSDYFIGKSYVALGYSHLLATDYPEALKYFLQALSIWKALGDYTHEVQTILFIVDIHAKNGNLSEAKQYAEDAIRICTEQGVGSLEAKALNELAMIYERLGRSQDAIAIYKKGIVAARREGDKYFEAFLLGNIGSSYKSLDQNALALQSFRTAARLGDSMQDPYILTVADYNMADIYLQDNRVEESEKYTRQALAIARQINETETTIGCYALLRRIAEKRGDYKTALAYFRNEVSLRDTVFNQQKSAQLTEMQTKFDTRLKDAQISDQHRQIALTRRTNVLLILCIALVAGIGLFIWMQQRRTLRLHRQVARQKEELEKLNAFKNIVFSVISHDMRTPVNSLLAFTQLLDGNNITQEKLAAYGAELKTEMADTATLLENLLNWSKSQMDGHKPVIENFPVMSVVTDTVRLLSPGAQKKRITIRSEGDEAAVVKADINMTAIVVRNLLHNAIKYTPIGGEIFIALTTSGNSLQMTVQDNGAGFSPERVDAFNAASANGMTSLPGTANEQGTGLGLLLCRTFLKQMNGTITLSSGNGGPGSAFIVTLPAGVELV